VLHALRRSVLLAVVLDEYDPAQAHPACNTTPGRRSTHHCPARGAAAAGARVGGPSATSRRAGGA
jgi:hypothetical protein